MNKISIIQKREIANEILSSKDGKISPKTEQFLNSIDNTVSQIKDTVKDEDFKNALSTTQEIVDTVSTIFECAMETRIAIKELDVVLKQMDLSVEKDINDSNISLEKFKTTAPILAKHLDDISNRMDKILDHVLLIDPKTCGEDDLKLRTKLIDMVNDNSNKISNLLLQLMSL